MTVTSQRLPLVSFGFLGVGHLAEALIEGALASGLPARELVLSPRGRAESVAKRFGLTVAADNAALVAAASVVVLGVRPAQARAALEGLPWRADQVIVSCCAGLAIADLADAAAPARVMRAMPLTAAAIGASPIPVHPDLAAARPLLDRLGTVAALASEADFEVATVSAAVYGWVQHLVGRSTAWSAARGLDPALARRLTALTFVAAGRVLAERDAPIEDLLAELATPGGITELGLSVLADHDVSGAWDAAQAAVLDRLRR